MIINRMINVSSLIFLLLWCNLCLAGEDTKLSYTSNDDVSWAVKSQHLSSKFGQKQETYDNFMKACDKAKGSENGCKSEEQERIEMNKLQVMSVRNYTSTGFAKIKAPEKLLALVNEFYQTNKHRAQTEWFGKINPYHNMWEVPTKIIRVDNQRLVGGGPDFAMKIHKESREVLEQWTGQRLSPVSAYGVRIYGNQSILAPHVDTMPRVISAIVNIDQDIDEPWPLEVYDHDGVAHNITMDPGEMVLYESHSIIHGRPFPMNGKLFANVFVHFEPIGSLKSNAAKNPGRSGLPPYLLPNSPWEKYWRKGHPDGWRVLNDANRAVQIGDIRAIQHMAQTKPVSLVKHDAKGWYPIHHAVKMGDLDAIKLLIEIGVNPKVKIISKDGKGQTALELAYSLLPKRDPIIVYLESQTPWAADYTDAPAGATSQNQRARVEARRQRGAEL